MRITEVQEKLLENFSCERLTAKEINRELIKNIENRRGDLLIEYLNTLAWNEDSEGEIAHYLVKSPEDEIVMFFSLKCGGLFDPLDEEVILQRVKYAQDLLTEIQKMKKGGVEREIALQILEQFRTGQDISIEQIQSIVDDGNKAKKVLRQLNYDKEHERNKKIIRVGNTYPSIELVHFCTNESYRDKWRTFGIHQPLGKVMFWKYIAPKVFEVQKIVGCQYLFLFAADASADGTLINYYNVELKFQQPNDVGTNKPRYDLCCEFMCQNIKNLKIHKTDFFENFNIDVEDEVI